MVAMVNMSQNVLTFDPSELQALQQSSCDTFFNGAFIDSNSYSQLLDLVDIYFGLGMKTDSCPYKLKEHCYMLISRQDRKLYRLLGKNVGLKISHIIHNEHYGVLVAKVILRTNFTCNNTPHIVIAKRRNLNHSVIRKIVDGEMDYKHPCIIKKLHAPCSLHGVVGVLCNSDLEDDIISGQVVNGAYHTGQKVSRPELTATVDNFPPPEMKKKYLSLTDLKTKKIDPLYQPEYTDSNYNSNSDNEYEENKPEYYQGCLVEQGPRGGKYIIKDGKKKYIKDEDMKEADAKGKLKPSTTKMGPVYSLNLLT